MQSNTSNGKKSGYNTVLLDAFFPLFMVKLIKIKLNFLPFSLIYFNFLI